MSEPRLHPAPPRPVPARPSLDPAQRYAAEHPPGAGHLLVVGAPGTGKTTTAIAAYEHRLGVAASPEEVLFLAPTRRAAATVRDELSTRLRATWGGVRVRTPASFAFSVLRARATLVGEPSPTLVTGPEQDALLAELLAGHRAGLGAAPRWPESVSAAARALPAFRDQLRDLLMRSAEAGLGPDGLAELGRRHGRAEWVAAAAVQAEYEQVLRLGQLTPDRGERFDAASIIDEAVAALAGWPDDAGPPRIATVVVDDLQDATLATARLLRALADDGAELLLFGDADAGVQGFRGGTPALVEAATSGPGAPGGFAASRVELPTAWRQVPALREVTRAVTAEVASTAGVSHRRAASGRGLPAGSAPSGAEVAVLRTRAQEAAVLARVLREEHLHHGTPYGAMAVVVRDGGGAGALRRMLADAGVPVATAAGEAALRDAPAVRPLLAAMEVALGSDLTPEVASDLLTSPLAGGHRLDAVSIRDLRRALRVEAAVGGDPRPTEELVVDVLRDPARCAALPGRVRGGPTQVARVLAAGRAAASTTGTSPETVLWAIWSAAGLAEPWRRTALAGGSAGERADRDLDAVLELFRAAEQFTDRNPSASAAEFVRHVAGQALPADSLAARGSSRDVVEVRTAAGTVGEEWDVVAVAGVQEGVWPDLRVRDSMLGAHALADIAAWRDVPGAVDAWATGREVLQDELRAFAVAVSRARRRLIVTAVRDAELTPSPFLDLVDPGEAEGRVDDDGERPLADVAEPLDLRGLVARLRAELPDGPDAGAAADLLAHLASRGVPGADPAGWSDALEESTTAPLWQDDEVVDLTPSAVESALACPLRWALERVGGRPASGGARSLGSLVHAIAADLPHGTLEQLRAELDRRWGELGLGAGWPDRRQRKLADAVVERLASYLAGRPGRVETEVAVEVTLGRARLSGRIDRVEHGPDGAVRVVDLKTGRPARTDAFEDPQLGAYQVVVRRGALGEDLTPAGGSLVYLGAGAAPADRTQPALDDDWAEEMIADVARTAAAATFPATVGDACRTCPVASSCPARPDGARVCR